MVTEQLSRVGDRIAEADLAQDPPENRQVTCNDWLSKLLLDSFDYVNRGEVSAAQKNGIRLRMIDISSQAEDCLGRNPSDASTLLLGFSKSEPIRGTHFYPLLLQQPR